MVEPKKDKSPIQEPGRKPEWDSLLIPVHGLHCVNDLAIQAPMSFKALLDQTRVVFDPTAMVGKPDGQ